MDYRQANGLFVFYHLKDKSKCSVLYSGVSSPLDLTKPFTLFASTGRPVHSDNNSASPGSIPTMQQLSATIESLTFPRLSIADKVLI